MEDYHGRAWRLRDGGHGQEQCLARPVLTSPNYPGTVFRVRDSGAYGNGKTQENWVDIAYTDPEKAKHMLLPRLYPSLQFHRKWPSEISASRANLLRTLISWEHQTNLRH